MRPGSHIPIRLLVTACALVLSLFAGALVAVGCSGDEAPTTTVGAKLDKLTLVAPPGPMAIPLAYLVANDKLAGVAEQTELVVWENADQLKAIVAGGQGDFVTVLLGAPTEGARVRESMRLIEHARALRKRAPGA